MVRQFVLFGIIGVFGACFSPDFSDTICGDGNTCPDSRVCDVELDRCVASVVQRTLSHTRSQEVRPGNSTACTNTETGFHGENRIFRFYDLAALGVDREVVVTHVQVGIQEARAGSGGSQSVEVRLHELVGVRQASNLVQLASANPFVSDGTVGTIDVAVNAKVSKDTVLAVEFFNPPVSRLAIDC